MLAQHTLEKKIHLCLIAQNSLEMKIQEIFEQVKYLVFENWFTQIYTLDNNLQTNGY